MMFATSVDLLGDNDFIIPLMIPTELKLAKLANTKVDTNVAYAESWWCCIISPNELYAKNSLIAIFCPIKLPINSDSCQLTPNKKANGRQIIPSIYSKDRE